MTGTLNWLFLDLNSYFASVEQQERPELRGKPVAVVPMETDYTCAIAASYEAKAYGVKTGTKIYEAKKMCPGLRCVLARHHVYVDYHYRIMDEIENHLHIDRVWSIDEVACSLLGRERLRENALALARQIKDGLRRNVGAHIRCSIGLAPTGFLAKVATEMQKPDGLVVIEEQDLPGPLFDLKLTDLPGINVNMERRLNNAGIKTIEQFWNLSPKHARKIWGGVQGERFWMWLHGQDAPAPETKRGIIGHSRVLDPDLRAPDKAKQMARRLTTKAATRLRREEFYATSFTLSVKTVDGRRWAGEARLPPTQDNFSFLKALEELWNLGVSEPQSFGISESQNLRISEKTLDSYPDEIRNSNVLKTKSQLSPGCTSVSMGHSKTPRFRDSEIPRFHLSEILKIKKLSITLTGLVRRREITPDLFDTRSEEYQKIQTGYEKLSQAMDKLNGKYGAETVQLGPAPQTRAGYVGTKIAFTRVPDRAEFWE